MQPRRTYAAWHDEPGDNISVAPTEETIGTYTINAGEVI
jgi:hypothetical protein